MVTIAKLWGCSAQIALTDDLELARIIVRQGFFSLRRGEAQWDNHSLACLFGLSILIPMNAYRLALRECCW